METITLKMGKIENFVGLQVDSRRPVTFRGEKLAIQHWAKDKNKLHEGASTLYRTEDGRLIVFLEERAHKSGEANYYDVIEISLDDVQVGGRFEQLGHLAGLARPLTLDEALKIE